MRCRRINRVLPVVVLSLGLGWNLSAWAQDSTSDPQWVTPVIEGHGEVVALPQAAVQPQAGSQVVFDLTRHDQPGETAKGLARVARWLNLNATAGIKPEQVQIALVLHGDATRVALSDPAYQKHAGVEKNPNLELVRDLKSKGVEVLVCGQALAHRGFGTSEVADEVTVVTAALTVLIQRQQAGHAVLSY